MAVTLRDVAARAGVSPVVVSKVLHNRAQSIRVSEATAERVREAARELGYRVNVLARSFRSRQTQMIGVLHGLGFSRPLFNSGSHYFASLMDGIVEGAFEFGYSVTLCPKLLGQSPEDAMTDGRFDGLVWYSTEPSEANRRMLLACSVPLVLIHSRSKDFDGKHPAVICDNAGGIGLAVDHLVSLGHRRIAFALDALSLHGESLWRYEAYRQHLLRHRITATQDDLIGAEGGILEIERSLSDRRYTAIVCHGDGLAAQILEVGERCGIRVPEELSVIGFDSTGFCNELRPRLTSIHQPLTEIGRQAVGMLVKVIRDEPLESQDVVLPCRLDIRESTAPVR